MITAGYRPDIDGLRGIAVLGVVAYHAGIGVSGGFAGVDVFFVISGFLITQLLLNEIANTGTVSIRGFYSRRVRRLLPALSVVMVATLVAGQLLLPGVGKENPGKSSIASLLFLSNQYFLRAQGGYFAEPSGMQPLLHLWSLAVEEQFYLIWPILLIVTARFCGRWGVIPAVRLVAVVLTLASFAVSNWMLTNGHAMASFYTLPSRAWELGAGVLIASVPLSARLVQPVVGTVAGLAGLALVTGAFFVFRNSTPFPGAAATAPVAGSALIILAGLAHPGNVVARVLSLKPITNVGLLSYGWYLWHWPLLSIAKARRLPEVNPAPMDCALCLIALLLAWLTYRYVETPLRRGAMFRAKPRTVLATGAVALAFLLMMASAMTAVAKYGPKSKYTQWADRETPPQRSACLIWTQEWNGHVFREACHVMPEGAVSEASPLIVLWGDSYADAWSPGIRKLTESMGEEFQEVSFASCPPLADTTVLADRKPLPHCRDYNSTVVSALTQRRSDNPKREIGVVLAARWLKYLGEPIFPGDQAQPVVPAAGAGKDLVAANIEGLSQGLRRTLKALDAIHVRSMIILDGPEFRMEPIRYVELGGNRASYRERRDGMELRRKPAADAVRQAAAEFESARVVDPMPFFCGAEMCPGFLHDFPATYDAIHISVSASKAFAPLMMNTFQWLTARN